MLKNFMFFVYSTSVKKSTGNNSKISNYKQAETARNLTWKYIYFSFTQESKNFTSQLSRTNTPNKSPGNPSKKDQKEKIPIKNNLNEKKKGCGNFCTIQ